MGNYINQNELYDEYKNSVDNDQCTEKLGTMFLTMTEHILRSPSFNRYPQQVKEDLRGHALEKLMKSLRTVKLQYTPQQIFNFVTRAIYNAYFSELARHYKQEGIKRAATRKYLENSPFIDAKIREDMINEIDAFEAEIMEKKKNTREKKLKKANS